jgi:predicted permease
MSRLGHDFRLAVRGLLGAKGPVGFAIVTLALGIGVTSAVFSILDAVLLRPVPFAHADRLADVLNFETKSQVSHPGFPPKLLAEWRRQTDLFERVEAYDVSSSIFDASAGAEMVTGATVTPGLLAMLGVTPAKGRLLGEGDGRGGSDDRLVISDAFWRKTFGRDPQVVGRTLTLDGRTHTIVGVMPSTFRFPNEAILYWRPYDPEAPPARTREPNLGAMVRLRPDVSPEVAAERVKARGQQLNVAAGGSPDRGAILQMADASIDRKLRLSLQVLGGAVGFLLLIVCANLANLSLSRTLTRARDFAVRSSLGASRGDLLREIFLEQALIGVIGVAGGLVVAALVLEATLGLLPRGFRLTTMNAIDLDWRTLTFTGLVGFVTVLLFGVPPAWAASKGAVSDLLRRDTRTAAGSSASRRMRSALVIAEVALAMVLLVGAALMGRSLVKLQHVERGFDAAGLVAMRVGLPRTGYADVYARDTFTAQFIDRLKTVPGISAASSGGVPPDASMISFGKFERADRPGELSDEQIIPVYQVWPNYFESLGLRLRAGRAFTDAEPRESIIVSDSFARKFWPDGNSIGQRVRFEGDIWRTIVGVAAEVRQMSLDDETGSYEWYYPLKRPAGLPQPATPGTSAIVSYRTFVVRADNPAEAMTRMRAALREIDSRVVVWRVDEVERLFADAVARPRLVLLLMLVFSGLGLVLAAAGLYGVLSHAVVRRRREIGIRLALGAQRTSVGRLILNNGLALTGVGLAAGITLALALMRVMRALLYEVEPTDPLSVGGVSLLLILVAAAASWWPVRRAMALDPLRLLKEE